MSEPNTERVMALLSNMTRLQKRVAMLLSYLAEYGPTRHADMAKVFPKGVLGELNCAHRHDFIEKQRDTRYILSPKGKEVVAWLCGYRQEPPSQWSNIINKPKFNK